MIEPRDGNFLCGACVGLMLVLAFWMWVVWLIWG